MTKLRAFVEAGRSHVGTRDQRRGGSGGIVRTSEAISAAVFGRGGLGGGGRVGGVVGGGGGVERSVLRGRSGWRTGGSGEL